MAVTFHPLPVEVFPEDARPYIKRLNAELFDLFALEGRLKDPIAPLNSKRSDASVARNAEPLIDVSRVTPEINQLVSRGITGPHSSTVGDVVQWSNTKGTSVSDSGKLASDLVTGPGSAVSGSLASYNGATGKVIADSGVVAANVVAASSTMTPDNSIVRVDGVARNIQSSGLSIDDSGRLHVSNTSGQGFGSSVSNSAGNIAFLFKDEIGTSRAATSYWLACQNSAGTQKFQVNAPTGAALTATMAVGTATVKSSMAATTWVFQGDSNGAGGSDPGCSFAVQGNYFLVTSKTTQGVKFVGGGATAATAGVVFEVDGNDGGAPVDNDSGFSIMKRQPFDSGAGILLLLDYNQSTWEAGTRAFQIHDTTARGFLMEINPLGRINHSAEEIDSYIDSISNNPIKVDGLAGGRLGFLDLGAVGSPND